MRERAKLANGKLDVWSKLFDPFYHPAAVLRRLPKRGGAVAQVAVARGQEKSSSFFINFSSFMWRVRWKPSDRGGTILVRRRKPIRILAVDDHPIFRQGIAGLLADQADMSLVAEAADGQEAIQQFRAHRPDITLMDLKMPETNGLDAMIAIHGEFPDARIIVLTTYTGDIQVGPARRSSADRAFA